MQGFIQRGVCPEPPSSPSLQSSIMTVASLVIYMYKLSGTPRHKFTCDQQSPLPPQVISRMLHRSHFLLHVQAHQKQIQAFLQDHIPRPTHEQCSSHTSLPLINAFPWIPDTCVSECTSELQVLTSLHTAPCSDIWLPGVGGI